MAGASGVCYLDRMLERLIALVLAASLPAAACAQPDDPRAKALLDAHNAARAAASVPPLSWSSDLAADAREWTAELVRDDCYVRHSDTGHGENLYRCVGACKANKKGVKKAVASWAGEGRWLDAATGTCSAPAGESCGHYTQVIWCDSRELGCAWAECGDGLVVVCRYEPAGNWRGRTPLDCSGVGSDAGTRSSP